MGSGASSSSSSSSNGYRAQQWNSVFQAMQFTRSEIKTFMIIFNSIDTDGSGCIEVAELLHFLGIEASIFAERIFAAFDKDGTGKIDFFEFVVSLWKFCALGEDSLVVFAFSLYDTDSDGALTDMEVKIMFHDLYWYGSKAVENEASRNMLQALLGASDGVITLEEFRPFCLSNKVLLMPLFSVQEKLRNAAMGKTFWEDMAARRVQLTASRTVPLADLMVQAGDREQFYKLLRDEEKTGMRQMMKTIVESVSQAIHFPRNESMECRTESLSDKLFNPIRSHNLSVERNSGKSIVLEGGHDGDGVGSCPGSPVDIAGAGAGAGIYGAARGVRITGAHMSGLRCMSNDSEPTVNIR
mmetsp:Transcript_15932/g.32272  ORF Transcript_15932/g.32272 Transcript_15932/m.32272 type:complete len:355 (-) Transcript_15932:561-1625(-)